MVADKNISQFKVINVIEKPSGVLPKDGHKIYHQISELFDSGYSSIIIDFNEMRNVTTAFINSSIGKFLMENPQLSNKIDFAGAKEDLLLRIKRSKDLATNPKLRKIHNESIEEVLID